MGTRGARPSRRKAESGGREGREKQGQECERVDRKQVLDLQGLMINGKPTRGKNGDFGVCLEGFGVVGLRRALWPGAQSGAHLDTVTKRGSPLPNPLPIWWGEGIGRYKNEARAAPTPNPLPIWWGEGIGRRGGWGLTSGF